MAKPNLADYITVAERIGAFYEAHKDGSIQTEVVHDDGKRVVVKAHAFRTPTDPAPATGHAEEIRGDGPVNKTSALENCETSAVGRAIAMLGFEVKKGIASREEVEQAIAEEQRQRFNVTKPEPSKLATERANALRERMKAMHLSGPELDEIRMKLTSYGAASLEELPEDKAVEFSHWLSQQAEKKKVA